MDSFAFWVSVILASLIGLFLLWCIGLCCLLSFCEGIKKKRWLAQGKTPKTENEEPQAPKSTRRGWAWRCYDGLYKSASMMFSRLPSNQLRLFLYRHVFKMTIGKKAALHKGTEIRCGHKISIGKGTIVGDDCLLDGRGGLTIGDNVNFSSKASVYTAQHSTNDPYFSAVSKEVIIADRAWISANTIVLPGVKIGEGSILAAGAVATKELLPYGVYAGVPAKKIAERSQDLRYEFQGGSTWFY